MTTEKGRFTKKKETMLLTLYSRALHSRGEDPLLGDPWAEQAVHRVDYDRPGRHTVDAEPSATRSPAARSVLKLRIRLRFSSHCRQHRMARERHRG
jgi:O-methyltransferase involved in polyketide biosynthesis